MEYETLETQLYQRISQEGGLAFLLVPGSMLLAARKEDKEGLVPKNFKPRMYRMAAAHDVGKLAAYSLAAYGLYLLAEKLF
ncbi:hypothetical protein HYU50_02800 [Candidatus Woesearchaeota archaeon]|nr:hypothetical protein [Candidatus Woesearchaeota archaeon]